VRRLGRRNHSIDHSISKKQSIRIPEWEKIVNGKSPKEDLVETDQRPIRKSSIPQLAIQIFWDRELNYINRARWEKSALIEVSPCIRKLIVGGLSLLYGRKGTVADHCKIQVIT